MPVALEDHAIDRTSPNGSGDPEMIRQGMSLARKGARANNGRSNQAQNGGRIPKITDEKIDLILIGMRRGYSMQLAFAMAGIGKDTFYSWINAAYKALERQKKGLAKRKRDRELIRLIGVIEEHEAQAEAAGVRNLYEHAARGSWQASLAFLERRFPERWAKSEERETSINVTVGYQSIQVAVSAGPHSPSEPLSDNELPGTPIPCPLQLTEGDPP